MLNNDQYQLLQSFVSIPAPTYAEIFEARAEVEDLTEQLEIKELEYSALEDDLRDAESDKEEHVSRCIKLEAALADALSWIAGDTLSSDLAETDKAFAKLYNVL